jgi:thiol:disulfide interchange protein DsbD
MEIRRLKALLCAVPMLAAGPSAAAQAQHRPIAWTGSASSTHPVAPGTTITVKLSARVDSGWHLYSMTQGAGGPLPTKIDVATGQPFTLGGPVRGPAPVKRFDQNFAINVEMYDGGPTFQVPVHVSRKAPPGATELILTARYQVCSATLCMPPYTERVKIPLTVATAAAAGT